MHQCDERNVYYPINQNIWRKRKKKTGANPPHVFRSDRRRKITHRSIKHFQHHHWPAWFLLVVRPTFLWSCMAQPSAAVWQNVLQNYPWLRHPHPTSTQHTRAMAALHHTVSTSAKNWGVRYSAACCFAPGRWRNRMICHRLWGPWLSATVTQTRVFPWGVGGGRGLRCLRLLLLVVLYHSLCRRGLSRWRHCWK